MYSGLGLIDWRSTGVRVGVDRPTCLFPNERAEVDRKCRVSVVHGVGQVSRRDEPMGPGRLQGIQACELEDLPLCPETECQDEITAWNTAGCIAKQYQSPEHQRYCESLQAYAVAALPFCNTGNLPPPPDCYDEEQVALRQYCEQHASQGPDPTNNALCYLMMHHEPYWRRVQGVPACRTPQQTTDEAPPPAPPVGPPPAEEDDEDISMAAVGVGGILLLLALGGGGYYLYQRQK